MPSQLRRFVLVTLALVSCAGDAAQDSVPATDAAADTITPPAITDSTLPADVALLPDSVLVRRGACPFECCVYGEWQARTSIPVLTAAADGAALAYTIESGQKFLADSGEVRVTQTSFVVVRDTVSTTMGQSPRFVPGDTLVLLDYRGEGTWNVWHRGRVLEFVEQFWGMSGTEAKAAVHGEYRSEWWVHVKSPRTGWFRADSTVRFSGADACGD